jgi:hypothetical protein
VVLKIVFGGENCKKNTPKSFDFEVKIAAKWDCQLITT